MVITQPIAVIIPYYVLSQKRDGESGNQRRQIYIVYGQLRDAKVCIAWGAQNPRSDPVCSTISQATNEKFSTEETNVIIFLSFQLENMPSCLQSVVQKCAER